MFNLADVQQSIFMVRPDVRRELPMSYDSPITTDYWDDDGTPAYAAMLVRLEREGVVLSSSAG